MKIGMERDMNIIANEEIGQAAGGTFEFPREYHIRNGDYVWLHAGRTDSYVEVLEEAGNDDGLYKAVSVISVRATPLLPMNQPEMKGDLYTFTAVDLLRQFLAYLMVAVHVYISLWFLYLYMRSTAGKGCCLPLLPVVFSLSELSI